MSEPQFSVDLQEIQNSDPFQIPDNQTSLLLEMGHELRAPLHTILGYNDFIREYLQKDHFDPQEATRCLDAIASSGNFLLNMLSNMLELARLDQADAPRLRMEDVSIVELITRLEEQLNPLIREQENRLEWVIMENLPPLKTDRQRLLQILINLLTNAAKFTRQGHVKLSVSQEGSHLAFVVEDTGVGMSPDQLAHLFTPFSQQVGDTTGSRTSAGLGLYISQKLTAILQGKLSVQSSPGKGSTFSLQIPLQPAIEGHRTPNRMVPIP